MVAIQAAFITTTSGGQSTDRIIWPLSTFEYAATPNKTQQGVVTSYWYDRQVTPQVVLWPVPDDSATYVLNFRILHQVQDVSLVSGATLELPYRWLDSWVSALAARLADIYPDAIIKAKGPNAVADMWAKAERAWTIAATEDEERVPLFIQPQTSAYYR